MHVRQVGGGSNTIQVGPRFEKISRKKELLDELVEKLRIKADEDIAKWDQREQVVGRGKQKEPRPSKFEFPASYKVNTSKEETVLQYVEDFRRQYVQVFPDRRALLLNPLNECGLRKFVCTTVVPSLLPYHKLYDLESCAEFVADFLTYLPLEDPTKIPDLLPSPSVIAQTRHGDSLDMAVFLCSLLRGARYNAYVVSGYAPKWVTTVDVSGIECPEYNPKKLDLRGVLDEKDAKKKKKSKTSVTETKQPPAENKYKVEPPRMYASEYLKWIETDAKEKQAEKRKIRKQKAQFKREELPDPLEGVRVHFWVLIKPGRREVENIHFVEPTTGKVYDATDSKDHPYLSVESLWNEQNYWANVQEGTLDEHVWDLEREDCWEYVLIDEEQVNEKESYERVMESGAANPESKDEDFDPSDILDAPTTWCEPLRMNRATYIYRFPEGFKTINYYKTKLERFSVSYTGTEIGLVRKTTKYTTADCLTPCYVQRIFEQRSDHLCRRDEYVFLNLTS